jgi:WD40 repeat protein
MEMKEADQSGSGTELGLAIGAKIRMVKSSTIQQPGTSISYGFALNPDDNNEYIMPLASGGVLRKKRFGADAVPSTYSQMEADGFGDACTCVAYNPFSGAYFLAGFDSGTVCLFNTSSSRYYLPFTPTHHHHPTLLHNAFTNPIPPFLRSICSWLHVCKGGVKSVAWLPLRAGVFFALDGAGAVHVWDVLKNTQGECACVGVKGDTTPTVKKIDAKLHLFFTHRTLLECAIGRRQAVAIHGPLAARGSR